MEEKRKHVLFMTYDGLTDPLGQSQVLPYLEGLSERGYRYTLITFDKPGNYARIGEALKRRCRSRGIRWISLRYTKEPPVLSTLYDMEKARKRAVAVHAFDPFDLFHARSYLPCLVAEKFKAKYGVPYLFDMRGFYADERADAGVWNLRNPVYASVYRFFKKKEQKWLRESAAVVSLTEAGKAEILHGAIAADIPAEKVTVIPCTADLNHFDPERCSADRKQWLSAKYGLAPDATYLGYVGSLGTWYMVDEMLDFYGVLRERQPEVRFLVLTRDDPSGLRAGLAARGIPQSAVTSVAAERKDMPDLMGFMAASVFFILPAFSKKASSPTKQGELMAMGVPVICNAGVGDTAEIVRDCAAGVVGEDCSIAVLEALADKWQELMKTDDAHIREGAIRRFSLAKGVSGFREAYETVSVMSKQRNPQASDGSV